MDAWLRPATSRRAAKVAIRVGKSRPMQSSLQVEVEAHEPGESVEVAARPSDPLVDVVEPEIGVWSEEPDGRAPYAIRGWLGGEAVIFRLAGEHEMNTPHRLPIALYQSSISAAVPVPGERLVDPIELSHGNERRRRRVAHVKAVRLPVVGDAKVQVARCPGEQAARPHREVVRRRE